MRKMQKLMPVRNSGPVEDLQRRGEMWHSTHHGYNPGPKGTNAQVSVVTNCSVRHHSKIRQMRGLNPEGWVLMIAPLLPLPQLRT